jgi:hypothetical protein
VSDAEASKPSQSGSAEGAEAGLPALDFATFVLSLNHSALVHLGLAPDPTSGQSAKNLQLAKQTIDLLGMLHEKTRGNLTGDEERILDHALYELRLSYVEAIK